MEKRIRKNYNVSENTVKALEKMKKETGDGKSTIVRRAVNEFMYSEIKKKIEDKK